MTLAIKVYSDYVCPFCFIAEQPLMEAIKGKDVEVEWMPFELRPYPNETLEPEGDYLQSTWKSAVYPLAEKYGVPIVLPNVSPQPYTHLAFEGFQFAKAHGKGNTYNHRMFAAFFQEEQNIGDMDVLTSLAEEIGLNAKDFRQSLVERTYKDTHQQALDHAMNEVQISAVPSIIIGDKQLSGLHNREKMEAMIDQELNKPQISIGEGMVCGPDGCF